MVKSTNQFTRAYTKKIDSCTGGYNAVPRMTRATTKKRMPPPDVAFQHKWTLYFHFISKDRSRYAQEYIPVATVSTAVEFWNLFNNIPPVSALFRNKVMCKNRQIGTYSLFQHDVLPEWEDVRNANGAEWCMRESLSDSAFDAAWMEACLAAVGCKVNCVGIRVTFKYAPNHRIVQKLEVWMDDTSHKQSCMRDIRYCIGTRAEWQYFPHQDTRSRADVSTVAG